MTLKYKKGFLPRDFVATLILFGLIIAMYIIQVQSVASNYGNTEMISSDFSQHYSKLTDSLTKLDTSYSVTKGTGGLNLIGTFNVAFNAVFTVIVMVWDGIAIYSGMAGQLVSDYTFLDAGVVTLFMGAILAIVTVYLVFTWLSSVSRGKI